MRDNGSYIASASIRQALAVGVQDQYRLALNRRPSTSRFHRHSGGSQKRPIQSDWLFRIFIDFDRHIPFDQSNRSSGWGDGLASTCRNLVRRSWYSKPAAIPHTSSTAYIFNHRLFIRVRPLSGLVRVASPSSFLVPLLVVDIRSLSRCINWGVWYSSGRYALNI